MLDAPLREVGDVSVEAGRANTQMGWYRLATQIVAGHTVLDAGCGLGFGTQELARLASCAEGQDLDPRLAKPGVHIQPLTELADKSFDYVVSIDVVEHVPDDAGFVRELARIARLGVLLTTPLSCLGRDIWPYHIREYRAREFLDLISPLGDVSYFLGSQSGEEIFEIRRPWHFWTRDFLVNNRLTNVPFRAVQKLLPPSLRYNAHQGALIRLRSSS